MLIIKYTPSTNIDEDTEQPIDNALIVSADVNAESDIARAIGDNTLVAIWDKDEYDDMQILMASQYARNRAEAYPSLTDQADMAYWDRQNGTTTLDDAIAAVKDANPKP